MAISPIAKTSLILATLGVAACGGGSSSSNAPQSPTQTPSPPTPTTPPVAQLPVPAAAPLGEDFHPADKGWVAVWSDDFAGSELDRTKWEVEESCWGGGNDERQCYTDRTENVEVVNGLLRLKAYPETYTAEQYPVEWADGRGAQITQQYTSGKVRTREIADWTYGRFSARMKLPSGQGTWPAFWMLPADNVYGNWAASGEIDIMEAVNLGASCADCEGDTGENRTLAALHYGGEWPNNAFQSTRHLMPNGLSATDEYHVYAIEWGEGRINWFVDNQLFYTLDSDQWNSGAVSKDTHPHAPFDQDFHLLLNLAIGGAWAANVNEKGIDESVFPQSLEIDYVRVYECSLSPLTGAGCEAISEDAALITGPKAPAL